MTTKLPIDFMWIPRDMGGLRRTSPWLGMRCGIHWQRHYKTDPIYRDAEWLEVSCDPATMRGTAVVRLMGPEEPPDEWLVVGELLEFLDGYKVIAIARITAAQWSSMAPGRPV